MPFLVRCWPGNCDPRDSCFCIQGFESGCVPPFQYRATTTGALAPFTVLNGSGLLVSSSTTGERTCIWSASTGGVAYSFSKTEIGNPPYPPAPAITMGWFLAGLQGSPPFNRFEARQTGRLPQALATILTNTPVSFPTNFLVPNPVLLTPAPWDEV